MLRPRRSIATRSSQRDISMQAEPKVAPTHSLNNMCITFCINHRSLTHTELIAESNANARRLCWYKALPERCKQSRWIETMALYACAATIFHSRRHDSSQSAALLLNRSTTRPPARRFTQTRYILETSKRTLTSSPGST